MTKIEATERKVAPVLERHGCRLVLATLRRERGGLTLRLLVERRGAEPARGAGVDHRLLSSISRDVGAVLDAEDAIGSAYNLEVSSPGIERPLLGVEDFARFRGRRVFVQAGRPLNGRRRFRGVLGPVSDGVIPIELEDGKVARIAHGDVVRANLEYDPDMVRAKAGDD